MANHTLSNLYQEGDKYRNLFARALGWGVLQYTESQAPKVYLPAQSRFFNYL